MLFLNDVEKLEPNLLFYTVCQKIEHSAGQKARTMLQNWKSLQQKCGVLGCCLPLLVHQYHALTSEIEIISIGIHDLAASQHQFLDVTKCFVSSKNWCWLAGKS